MARHKMSLSVEYVSDWGVQEALRELFQNAIDYGNWSYCIVGDELSIMSHETSLDKASLLLGHSRKSEGAIGKFGEGYKLAMLVLTRLGYKCEIYTGNEIWEPKLIQSRTYKTQQLVFDTRISDITKQSLSFTVSGLSELVLAELSHQNLHITPTIAYYCHDKGIVIPERPGDIFVNGLFVAHVDGYKFGYNFKPSHLSLDRDRRLVRDFDIQWLTSQIWKDYEDYDLVLQLIKEEAPDVKYLDSFVYNASIGLVDEAAKAFVEEHGADAVPVATQTDLNLAKEQGHETVILMPPVQKQLIYRSNIYIPPAPKIVKQTPREILYDFYMLYKSDMGVAMEEDFEELLEKARGWII